MKTNDRWNIPFLQSRRMAADDEADAVVAGLVQQHSIDRVNEILRSLVNNDGILPEHMPAEINAFLEKTAVLPTWADLDLIRKGEDFFDRHWPMIVMFLFCAALPNAYAAHRGAQVLYLTNRLTERVERRIFETAQFVLDVMSPDGLSGSGRGIRSAQKVRLIHAAIRQHILHHPKWRERWDMEWGLPINQEDMAGTLMTFSVQILDGFRRFKIPIAQDEQEAYLHAWKVVGHLMGVEQDLMPDGVQDAYTLAYAILDHQKGESEAGRSLTSALVSFMSGKIPIRPLRGLPVAMIRRSIEPDIADLLGLPKANWTGALVTVGDWIARLYEVFDDDEHVNPVLDRISVTVVQALINLDRGGERTAFTIPDTLRALI